MINGIGPTISKDLALADWVLPFCASFFAQTYLMHWRVRIWKSELVLKCWRVLVVLAPSERESSATRARLRV